MPRTVTPIVAALAVLNVLESRGVTGFVVVPIPGRPPSDHFTAEVRTEGGDWQAVYVAQTTAKNASAADAQGYFGHLNFWSASWLSIELASPTETIQIRIQRSAAPISSATVHPRRCNATMGGITAAGAVVSVAGPSQFTVDVDGGLDEVDTGPKYKGPPMHTFSVFVNPPLQSPNPKDPNVTYVAAGAPIPSTIAPNTTLLFGPGLHRLAPTPGRWPVYTLPDQVTVHVPAGAVLHFALNNAQLGTTIRLEGYGVLSGEEMDRCNPGSGSPQALNQRPTHAPRLPGKIAQGQRQLDHSCDNNSPQGLTISNARIATVTGVTFVDFPNHHIIAVARREDCGGAVEPASTLANVKILGWRANGDGVHVFGDWAVRDLFMRTQDDSMYTDSGPPRPNCPGTTFTRISTWNDANGASFIFGGTDVTLQQSTVLYARASWGWWTGGRVFANRQQSGGSALLVDDVQVEDLMPSLNAFELDFRCGESASQQPGRTMSNATFKNVHVAALSTLRDCPNFGSGCNCVPACTQGPLPAGVPNVLLGGPAQCNVSSMSFVNVTVAGVSMATALTHGGLFNVTWPYVHNVVVDGVPVHPPSASKPFQGLSRTPQLSYPC